MNIFVNNTSIPKKVRFTNEDPGKGRLANSSWMLPNTAGRFPPSEALSLQSL